MARWSSTTRMMAMPRRAWMLWRVGAAGAQWLTMPGILWARWSYVKALSRKRRPAGGRERVFFTGENRRLNSARRSAPTPPPEPPVGIHEPQPGPEAAAVGWVDTDLLGPQHLGGEMQAVGGSRGKLESVAAPDLKRHRRPETHPAEADVLHLRHPPGGHCGSHSLQRNPRGQPAILAGPDRLAVSPPTPPAEPLLPVHVPVCPQQELLEAEGVPAP